MYIAIDANAALLYNGTGIGNYSYEIIKNILILSHYNDLKINIDLLSYSKNTPYFNYYKKFLEINKKFKNNTSFWNKIESPMKLKNNYDLFFCPHNGIGLPKHNFNKLAVTLHDVIPSKLPETVSPSYLKIYNDNIKNAIESCNLILTVSNFSKNDIVQTFNINENLVKVVYLAPSTQYKKLNKSICKNFLKIKYGIDFPYLLYIGGFSPRKNIPGLIESFSKVSEKFKNLKLLIVGNKGASFEKYNELSIKLKLSNKIIFTGFIDTKDLPYFYNVATIFIYPSFYEGFGLPPLESISCGTPVISSNLTSLPEILKTSVFYVNPHDTEEISDSINYLLSNPNELLNYSNKGLIHSNNFSWKKTANDTLSELLKC